MATGHRVGESDTTEMIWHTCTDGEGYIWAKMDSTACHKEQIELKLRVMVLFFCVETQAAGVIEILPESPI